MKDYQIAFFVFLGVSILVIAGFLFFLPRLTKVDKKDLIIPDQDNNPIAKILEEYYRIRNNQVRISFYFSIISASLGFMILLYTIMDFTILRDAEKIDYVKATVPLVSGIVIEAVAALFFRTQIRADREIQKNMDGLRVHALLNEFKEGDLKDQARKDVIYSLIWNYKLPHDLDKPNEQKEV